MLENLSPGFANNKGADQLADPHLLFAYCTQYLIVICLLESIIWAAAWDFQQYGMCDQQRLRPAYAYAQSDQSLCLLLAYSMTV